MPNFTYTRGIPASSHNPSVDQPDMQINNDSVDDIIAVDHYSFNDQNNLSGFHKVIDLVNQIAIPVLPGGVGCQLYAGGNNLIFKNAAIPLGTFLTNSAIIPTAASPGMTFLPGAMVMQWGGGVANGAGILIQPYLKPFTTIYSVVSGVESGFSVGIGVAQNSINLTQISLTPYIISTGLSIPGQQVWWIAIGAV